MSIFTVTCSLALLTVTAVQDLLTSFNFSAFPRNFILLLPFKCWCISQILPWKSASVEGSQNSDSHLRPVLRCLGGTSAKKAFRSGVLAHLSWATHSCSLCHAQKTRCWFESPSSWTWVGGYKYVSIFRKLSRSHDARKKFEREEGHQSRSCSCILLLVQKRPDPFFR